MRPWENCLPLSSVSFLIYKTWIIIMPSFSVNELNDILKVVWKCLLVDSLYKVGWQGECPLHHGIGKRMSGSHWAGDQWGDTGPGKGSCGSWETYGTSLTWIRPLIQWQKFQRYPGHYLKCWFSNPTTYTNSLGQLSKLQTIRPTQGSIILSLR